MNIDVKGLRPLHPDEPMAVPPPVIVLYAKPGMRKTSLAATAAKPFLIDYDSGLHRAEETFKLSKDLDRPFAFVRNTKAMTGEEQKPQDFYKAIRGLVEDGTLVKEVQKGGYKTVILDTGGTMLDRAIAPYLMALDNKNQRTGSGQLSLQGWGALSTEFNWICEQFRAMGLAIIIVCHVKDDEKGAEIDMKGGSRNALYAAADLIGFLEMKGANTYTVDFQPNQERIGKGTAGIGKYTIPHASKDEFPTFMQSIIDEYYSKVRKKGSAQQKAMKVFKEMQTEVNRAESVNRLDEIRVFASGMSPTLSI